MSVGSWSSYWSAAHEPLCGDQHAEHGQRLERVLARPALAA